jgi:hypothetical protein
MLLLYLLWCNSKVFALYRIDFLYLMTSRDTVLLFYSILCLLPLLLNRRLGGPQSRSGQSGGEEKIS